MLSKTSKRLIDRVIAIFASVIILGIGWLIFAGTKKLWPFEDPMKREQKPHHDDGLRPKDSISSVPELKEGETRVVLVGMKACPYCVEALERLKDQQRNGTLLYFSLETSTIEDWFSKMPEVGTKVKVHMKEDGRVPFFLKIRNEGGTTRAVETVVGFDESRVSQLF